MSLRLEEGRRLLLDLGTGCRSQGWGGGHPSAAPLGQSLTGRRSRALTLPQLSRPTDSLPMSVCILKGSWFVCS